MSARSVYARLITVAGAVAFAAMAVTAPAATADPASRSLGLTFAGLSRATDGPCVGALRAVVPGLGDVCTHGPDAAPAGIDVTLAPDAQVGQASLEAGATSAACIGDGTAGKRVQAIYAVAADRADNYQSSVTTIQAIAGRMEAAVSTSAVETGGIRHIRFVTNPDCSLNVARVLLSPTGDDTFNNMLAELRAQGYGSPDRKYLIWADALVYCGIAQMVADDRPTADNPSNTFGGYARVDRTCWGLTEHLTELHELMHTLGAVQASAPHASAANHCTDESDTMCYQDGAGVLMTYPCPTSQEWLLDCGHDDYFNTNPAPGSYLATHWNVANSGYLSQTLEDPVTPPATVTDTFTGTVSAKKPTRTFNIALGSGATTSTLSFVAAGRTKTPPVMSIEVLRTDGTVAARASGTSPLTLDAPLPTGSYTWAVSATTSLSFNLAVTRVPA